jgi:hypothetical protein
MPGAAFISIELVRCRLGFPGQIQRLAVAGAAWAGRKEE